MPNHIFSDEEPIFTPKEETSRDPSDVEAEAHTSAVAPASASIRTKDPLSSSNASTARHQSKLPQPPLPLEGPEPAMPVTPILAGPAGDKAKSFSVHSELSAKQDAAGGAVKASGVQDERIANNINCSNSFVKDDDDSLDSFAIPRYHVRYPQRGNISHGDVSVPWNLRPPMRRNNCTFFDFLRAPQFWSQFEFSLRITVMGVLIPGVLIAANVPGNPFVSPFMVFAATLLATKRTAGEAIAYIFIWIRSGFFWLPLSVIAGALSLGEHIIGWSIYYTTMLFIMAIFTDEAVRRICLLLFNSCTVGLLVRSDRGAVFPCRVMVDWCIGTGLCVVAAFVPYPLFCKREAQRLLRDIGRNTATAYRGLVYSFWSPSNAERNMAMSKVRSMTESLDVLLPLFEYHQSFSFYEFLFESAEEREIRALKFALFERLRINLSSMTRVLDMLEAKPSAIDNSGRSKACGELLNPHLNAVAEVFDELLDLLAHATTRKALMRLQERFECFADRTDDLQDAFKLARRMIFYEYTSGVLEEFVPLMTFYLFTVVCVRNTMDIFQTKVKAYHPSFASTLEQIWIKTVWDPVKENLHFLGRLFREWNRREVQRVIEAAKVSGAMILTIGFSYLIKIDKDTFSGPNIIAFVAGSNPVETVQASIVRLTGCLVGTVLGFFAGTYSETPVQRVASLCTLIFCGTFLRYDKEYGIMAVYGTFVLIPLVSIAETTVEDTVSRMNQNTFGIFIYLFVSVLVLPLSPGLILRAKRRNVLRCMTSVISSMMDLFSVPLVNDPGLNKYSIVENYEPQDEQPLQNAGRGDNSTPRCSTLTNRSLHLLARTDTAMVQINKQLVDLMRRLKSTKDMMKFAQDERTLLEVDYPRKACDQTYLHMYRMTMLLQTMWMSWNVIRSQRTYTESTRRMMRNLQPVAHDVAGAFQRFVDLMCYMIHEPSINLEGDIMKAVLDLIDASDALHCRKSQIMLMLINQSVENYTESNDSGDVLGDARSKFIDTSTNRHPDLRNLEERDQRSMQGAATVRTFGEHQQPPSQSHSPRLRNSPWHCNDTSQHNSRPSSSVMRGPNSPLPATFDGVVDHFTPTPATSPTSHGYNFHVVASERNVSVLPYLRKVGTKEGSEHSVHPVSPVHLPANFQFPVTSEDVEGLHSFTMSMEMFANETKFLMVSMGMMIDKLRSKL
ncbi:hypothetical protein, conserved [Leishmania tarentolae]|uniref:Integral membrane bound transporter domain-containing protein n=1 Tax=Leishmania tarentolae TaxID=5689 RepID=A0A640KZA8_LEITA|nr:hypothetical protein, conserved [Leishmania tarentolae]